MMDKSQNLPKGQQAQEQELLREVSVLASKAACHWSWENREGNTCL